MGCFGRAVRLLLMVSYCNCVSPAVVATGSSAAPTHRVAFEIIRVDDTIDPLRERADSEVSPNEGIALQSELVSLGPGRVIATHFALAFPGHGESKGAVNARLRRWLDQVALPPGAHFALGDVMEYDPVAKTVARVGVRSFILAGESVVHADDVAASSAFCTFDGGSRDVHVR